MMNDWKSFENELRSWKPRRASASLKRRLFDDQHATEPPPVLVFGGHWRWLAPAMASCLLILALVSPKEDQIAYFASGTNQLLSLLSNQNNHAALISEGFHSRQNLPDSDTFEWTQPFRPVVVPVSYPNLHTNLLNP